MRKRYYCVTRILFDQDGKEIPVKSRIYGVLGKETMTVYLESLKAVNKITEIIDICVTTGEVIKLTNLKSRDKNLFKFKTCKITRRRAIGSSSTS